MRRTPEGGRAICIFFGSKGSLDGRERRRVSQSSPFPLPSLSVFFTDVWDSERVICRPDLEHRESVLDLSTPATTSPQEGVFPSFFLTSLEPGFSLKPIRIDRNPRRVHPTHPRLPGTRSNRRSFEFFSTVNRFTRFDFSRDSVYTSVDSPTDTGDYSLFRFIGRGEFFERYGSCTRFFIPPVIRRDVLFL